MAELPPSTSKPVPTVARNSGTTESSDPLLRESSIKTSESSSTHPSPRVRPSSLNTTPRQGNRKNVTPNVENSKNVTLRTESTKVKALSQQQQQKLPTCATTRSTLKKPEKCPLLCCFYAEFDNKQGPKICFQSPSFFMEQDIRKPVHDMEKLLHTAFASAASGRGGGEEVVDDWSGGDHPKGDDFSIFSSCSSFIITGNELTGNILNFSTHQIHVLTRPTMISDEKYERNSLLFCLGFVLRRTEDPRPFRPVLSKLAVTLKEMEIESQFLSLNRDRIQPLLHGILIGLNSQECEYNMPLGTANVLNLKLFRPPKAPAVPVRDYDVPVLLRRDWQLQTSWDLSILWVSLFCDGVLSARQISKKAEVDFEMVRACLRVLAHHDVIKLVDMYFYTNRYECTEKMATFVPGMDSTTTKLLHDAVEYVTKKPASTSTAAAGTPVHHNEASPELTSSSPNQNKSCELSPHKGSLSFSFEQQLNIKEGHLLGGAPRIATTGNSYASPQDFSFASSMRRDEHQEIKNAIAEIFCGCHRGISVGRLWIDLVSSNTRRTSHIDWERVFRKIDHRRLVTFGVVHGLIRRVHNFPLIVDRSLEVDVVANDHLPHAASTIHDRSRTRADEQAKRRQIVARATELMDGVHCDDEIACLLELSLDEVCALLHKKTVVSLYSTDGEP